MIFVHMIVLLITICVKPAPKLPFRNHVYVMSVFKAKDSEGTINADLTGIQANFQGQLEKTTVSTGYSNCGNEHHTSPKREG